MVERIAGSSSTQRIFNSQPTNLTLTVHGRGRIIKQIKVLLVLLVAWMKQKLMRLTHCHLSQICSSNGLHFFPISLGGGSSTYKYLLYSTPAILGQLFILFSCPFKSTSDVTATSSMGFEGETVGAGRLRNRWMKTNGKWPVNAADGFLTIWKNFVASCMCHNGAGF